MDRDAVNLQGQEESCMDIICQNQLTECQKKQVQQLEELCAKEEGLKNRAFLSNELSFDKSLPCFYLAYDEEQLVSFLSVFIPTRQEAEVSAYTHPQHRRKGYFNTLLQKAQAVLGQAGVPKLLFVAEPQSKSAAGVLWHRNCRHIDRTEYTMEYTGPIPTVDGLVCLEPLSEQNKAQAVAISSAVFGMEEGEDNFIENTLKDPARKGFLAKMEEDAIGIFSLHFEASRVYLYGLGLLECYRGKGYGKNLVLLALRQAFANVETKTVVLDVDSQNPPALALYRGVGFTTIFQADYYTELL